MGERDFGEIVSSWARSACVEVFVEGYRVGVLGCGFWAGVVVLGDSLLWVFISFVVLGILGGLGIFFLGVLGFLEFFWWSFA